jgi:hypothetical protein
VPWNRHTSIGRGNHYWGGGWNLSEPFSMSSIHIFRATVLPGRRGSTEPRRRRERHAWWKSGRAEAGGCAWHARWRERHRWSCKGRGSRCRMKDITP